MAGLLLVIGWSYYFAIPANFRQFRVPQPDGYYGAQTEAFLAGQLHLNIPIDPKLLTLENPYAGPQGANRPHDMSYYRGHFYLYYGVTPVLLLYLPWRLVTGGYLGESLGSVMMLYGGVVLCAGWLLSARRRWFPSLGISWVLLLIAMIAFGPPLFPATTNNTFYNVPIACAFLCLMGGITAASRAVSSPSLGAKAGWLTTTSLFWGLAVGARPVYVLGLIPLGLGALFMWWTAGREVRSRWPGLRLIVAAIVPAALIGLGLMTYNYLRFDDPLDFGIRYSMASGDLREARLVGLEFIGKNLSLYLLEAMAFIRYYPFIIMDANSWGLLPHLPVVVLCVLFPFTWMLRPLQNVRWVLVGLLLAGTAGANLALLCLFFGEQERYLLDFTPPLLLLAAGTSLAALNHARNLAGKLSAAAIRLIVASVALYAIGTGLLLTFPRHAGTSNLIWLERLFNTPTHLAERLLGTEYGPLEIDVRFPRDRIGITEPLLTTGFGESGGDCIAVHYLDENHVRFQAFHIGRGGPISEPVRIDYAATHRLRLIMGSLYPPRGHPLFSDWPISQVDRLRRRLRIEINDQPVLQGNFTVYPSTPASLKIGHSNLAPDVSASIFTGEIISTRRLGLVLPDDAGYAPPGEGPVRITFRLPPRVGDEGLPLLATGRPTAGDLIFVQILDSGLARFGHDSFGAGAVLSPAMPYDPNVDQELEVEMGSLHSSTAPGSSGRLRLTFNGTTGIDTSRPFHPAAEEEVEFGFNTIMASTAIDYFPGAIRRIERIPSKPTNDLRSTWGPLRLVVRFPQQAATVTEPLLTTGRTGRGDVLFVRYEPDGTLRFGHDHWGIGADLSEPIRLDRSQVHFLEIHSSALLPPDATAAPLEVRLDGRTIFRSAYTPYRAERTEIHPGENPIGASSSSPVFTGSFLLQERIPR